MSKLQHGSFSLLAQIHFAYSQAGSLDVGKIYIPHDTVTAWGSGVLAHLLGGAILNNFILRQYTEGLTLLAFISIPYFIRKSSLRPSTWKDGDFEQWVEELEISRGAKPRDGSTLPKIPSKMRTSQSVPHLVALMI